MRYVLNTNPYTHDKELTRFTQFCLVLRLAICNYLIYNSLNYKECNAYFNIDIYIYLWYILYMFTPLSKPVLTKGFFETTKNIVNSYFGKLTLLLLIVSVFIIPAILIHEFVFLAIANSTQLSFGITLLIYYLTLMIIQIPADFVSVVLTQKFFNPKSTIISLTASLVGPYLLGYSLQIALFLIYGIGITLVPSIPFVIGLSVLLLIGTVYISFVKFTALYTKDILDALKESVSFVNHNILEVIGYGLLIMFGSSIVSNIAELPFELLSIFGPLFTLIGSGLSIITLLFITIITGMLFYNLYLELSNPHKK